MQACVTSHTLLRSLAIALSGVVCFFSIFAPVHAEETDSVPASVSTSTDTTPPQTTPPHPYLIENLLGDEVYGDFVVGPGKVEVSVKPGQTKIVEITVSNRTGVEREFILEAEDTAGSSDPSQAVVLLGSDKGPYSIKDYLSVPAWRFTLKHNERARIPVTIAIPPDAEPGGLYGSVLASTVSARAESGTEEGTQPKSAVVARIGSLFFISVPGNAHTGGSLKEFGTLSHKKVYQEGPIPFGILFENTGSVHLTPQGELRITNAFNEEVGFVTLEPWFVMPLSERLREITWTRELLFGQYTATLTLERGYEDMKDTMSYTFWVLPWKPVSAGFVGLFLCIFLIRTFFKKFEFRRK